jgi:hypothetical protein
MIQNIKNFFEKKINRLLISKKVIKMFFYYHKFFHDKNLSDLGFDFTKKKSRQTIVQEIIRIKKYKSYLEIGCFNDDLFSSIDCELESIQSRGVPLD